ncbi:MAG: GFA family protein [Haliea sp.]|nr:GFA family protein [Haliea sp.]
MVRTISGGCVCGRVGFTVEDKFVYAGYCHCSSCRKSSGASGTAIGGIPREKFSVTKGSDYIKKFSRSKETVSCFCALCGSTLYGEKPVSGMLHVRYGALNSAPELLPQAHMHVSSKADWYEICDSLPQYSEFPPG